MEASDNGENPKKLEMKSGGCHSDEGKIASFLKQHDSKKSDGLYKAVKGLKFKDILTGNLVRINAEQIGGNWWKDSDGIVSWSPWNMGQPRGQTRCRT